MAPEHLTLQTSSPKLECPCLRLSEPTGRGRGDYYLTLLRNKKNVRSGDEAVTGSFRASPRSPATLFSQGNCCYSRDPAGRRRAHLLAGNRQLRHVLSLQFTHKHLIALPIHGPTGVAYHIPAPEGQRLRVSAVPPSPAPERQGKLTRRVAMPKCVSSKEATVAVATLGPAVLRFLSQLH